MIEAECAALVAMVKSLYPAQAFDSDPHNVVKSWGYVVRDLGYDESRAAVARLSRCGQQWCSPGDVRREVARARNVLTPDVDRLLGECREVAAHNGLGRSLLHPAAQAAYLSVGGAQAIRRMDSRGLQSLRRAIEQQAEQHDQRTLESDTLPPAADALPPLSEQIAELAAQADRKALPAATNAHPETAEKLRRMTEAFGKVPE